MYKVEIRVLFHGYKKYNKQAELLLHCSSELFAVISSSLSAVIRLMAKTVILSHLT